MTLVPEARLYEGPLPDFDPGVDIPDLPARDVTVEGRHQILVRGASEGADPAPDHDPALFVHGLFSDSTYWVELDHMLSDRLDSEAIDLPGVGGSHGNYRNLHTLSAFARIIARYIEVSGRAPVHLAGNSLGGAIALLVAADWPKLVRTLTLISPAMPFQVYKPNVVAFASAPLMPFPDPGQMASMGGGYTFGDPSRFTPARERRFANVFRRQRSMRTKSASAQSMASLSRTYLHRGDASLWKKATHVQAPSLIVWGGRDRVVPSTLAPRLTRTIPDARLLLLDDVGHLAYVETPEEVARAMVALVEDEAAATDEADSD